MAYGVTDSGFNKKSREEILSDLEDNAQNYFGDDINLAANSPLGMILRVFSFVLALVWDTLEKLYNAFYINTATGQSLDNLVKYLGLSRQEATKASGQATFSGDDGTEIPGGFLIETDTSKPVQFETIESGTISSGSVQLDIKAVETGEEGNVASGTITVITNPLSGLDSVTNNNATLGGSDTESDAELRERYKRSTDIVGGATANSIRANVLENTDASACVVRENTSIDYDANNLPGKSIEVIVLAPEGTTVEENIAEAIFEKKSAGILAFGDITVTLIDDSGIAKDVSFSRGTQVDVYVDVTVTTNDDLPSGGSTLVEDEIIEYIGGTKADSSVVEGLGLGEDVIYTKVIDVAFNVTGVEDVSVTIGTSDNPSGTSNISIADVEVANTDSDKVDITVS